VETIKNKDKIKDKRKGKNKDERIKMKE